MVWKRLRTIIVGTAAIIGALFSVWFAIGFAQDLAEGDQTTGGYEYPYSGWQGTAIDYQSWYTTQTGLFHEGRVVHQRLNCTTGQITFSILGAISVDFRAISDRAKVVHQPQVACRALGYDTSAWDAIDDPEGLFTMLTTPVAAP